MAFPIISDAQSTSKSPAGDHVAYATRDALLRYDRGGALAWRFDFGPLTESGGLAKANCRHSLDGSVVWLFRPDAYSGRGGPDRWFALDAATGAVLGETALATPGGHGGAHLAHPDGVHMLLEVGCGQDGSFMFKGRAGDGPFAAEPWPGPDSPYFGFHYLADLAADGRHAMLVEHEGQEVVFADFASGEPWLTLALEDFGFDLEEDRLATVRVWFDDCRFLDESTAVVRFGGETDDAEGADPDWAAAGIEEGEEFTAYQAVDLAGRRVLGPCSADGGRPRPRFAPFAY